MLALSITLYEYPELSYWNFYLHTLRDLVTVIFDVLILELCHLSIQPLYQVWTGYDLSFQSYGDYNFPLTASLKVPIFTFLKVNGVKFQMSSFQHPKGTSLAGTTYNDVFCVGCVKDATCGRGEERKKGQKLSCVKLAICPHYHWNFACGIVSGN